MCWQNRLCAIALSLTFAAGSAAWGEEGPVKHYYNKTAFRIPVVIEDAERGNLAELKLYVRQIPGDWISTASGPATQKAFPFQATRDGEYWFNIITVDREGKTTPEDLKLQDPALVVIVDTQMPEVDVRPMNVSNGQTYLQCRIQDSNPDYSSVKMQYLAADGSWKLLTNLADTPGVVQISDPKILESKIRVKAGDKAGNIVEREVDLSVRSKTTPIPLPTASPKPVDPVSPPTANALPKLSEPLTPPTANAPPKLVEPLTPPTANASPMNSKTAVPALQIPNDKGDSLQPPLPPPGNEHVARPNEPKVSPPPVVADKKAIPAAPPLTDINRELPAPPPNPSSLPKPLGGETIIKMPANAPGGHGAEVVTMPIINSTRCRLDFALESTAGNIIDVEVFASIDGNRSWRSIGISKDGRSPALVEFPGEGKYGYAFVVRPASGLSSSLPKPGEAPDGWVEVDTTRPSADLQNIVPGTGSDVGTVMIHWVARDSNLSNEPVTLLFATQPGGPWQPIAERIANTGSYKWTLPRGVTSRVWIRLEVRDRAGNITGCETPQPVALEGPRAKVRIINVGPASGN